jgi:uncharacterized protein (TIGR00255 family)
MIHSMTGFGEAQREAAGCVYHLEVRSFNQRYLKTSIYLPEEFAFLENEVERVLRQRMTRGSVTVRMHVRSVGSGAALQLNMAAVQAYVDQLRWIAGEHERIHIDLATLLTLPGVSQPLDSSESQREQRWALLEGLLGQALDRLMAMRAAEGEALLADLQAHVEIIRRCLDVIRPRAPLVVAEYRDRLRARVEELLAGSNVRLVAEDLLKEVSIYAERSDISEELSRLDGHLVQFDALIAAREPAGRKLEFISQEMLREANTMGSKTGDGAIVREIIEIKSAIDRIKEQVQNAE